MKRFMKYLVLIIAAALFSTVLHAQSSAVHDYVTARIKVTVGDSATSTGNVGISTKNPTQKLDVNGGVRVRNLGEGIVVSDADGVLSTDTNITLKLVVTDSLRIRQLVNDSTAHILGTTDSGGVVKCVATCDDLRWTTVDGTQTVLRDSTDNVGIGTSSPTAKLHVDGDILSNGQIQLFDKNDEALLQIAYDGAFVYSIKDTTGTCTLEIPLNTAIDQLVITDLGSTNPYFQYKDGTEGLGKILVSDANGNATWQDPNAAPAARQSSTITPTDGGSDTIPDNTEVFIMNPASLLATYTLTLPANPVTNQLIRIVSSGFGITALTLNANTGQSIVGTLTTLAANVNALYFFDGSVWIKL